MQLITIETASLGDRTYVVHDGEVAAVIDPQRDIDRVMARVEAAGVRVVAVFETHVHNDYVSGGLELARATGANYHVSADEDLAFDHVAIRDGDEVVVGRLAVRVVHTPGHTPTHLSYVVSEEGGRPVAFTGGSLLYGSVGRTDLISREATEELSRLQFRSARRLAELLDDRVVVLPTHGFGSFCSSGQTTGVASSSIGNERRTNQALTIDDEDEFVAILLAGLDDWPAYYVHMGPANRSGPAPVDLEPIEPVDATEVRRRIHQGQWVVDLRSRRAFAGGHLVGTINVEMDDAMSTHLGWIMPWRTPVTLLGDRDAVAAAQRQLVRIGVDRLAGQADPAALPGSRQGGLDGTYEVTDHAGLARARSQRHDLVVLDARRRLEWEEGHVEGAVHIPLHELLDRMLDVPPGPVWVYCQTGYRASIAASLLARAGRDVVLVDDDISSARLRPPVAA